MMSRERDARRFAVHQAALRRYNRLGAANRIIIANAVMILGVVVLLLSVIHMEVDRYRNGRLATILESTIELIAAARGIPELTTSAPPYGKGPDHPVWQVGTPERAEAERLLTSYREEANLDLLQIVSLGQIQEIKEGHTADQLRGLRADLAISPAAESADLLSTGDIEVGAPDALIFLANSLDRNGNATSTYVDDPVDAYYALGAVYTDGNPSVISGYVLAGMNTNHPKDEYRELFQRIFMVGGVAVLFGIGVTYTTVRGLKRATGDYGTKQIAANLDYYASVLRAISEGLILVDRSQGITFYNAQAAQLLGISAPFPQTPMALSDLDLDSPMRELISSGRQASDEVHRAGRKTLVVNQQPASSTPDTWVMTMRDQTQLRELTGELQSMRSFSESLASKSHEFANRLHTIVSLVEIGEFDNAIALGTENSKHVHVSPESQVHNLDHPVLSALLITKRAQASEIGVEMRIDTHELESSLTGDDQSLVSAVGNLVDNGFEALSVPGLDPDRKLLCVHISGDADIGFTIEVSDDGYGLAEEDSERIFERGWSTKHVRDESAGHTQAVNESPRGSGLAIVLGAVRNLKGAIEVQARGTDSQDLRGATFSLWFPS